MELVINEEEDYKNDEKIEKAIKKKKKKVQKKKSVDYSFVFNQILNNYGSNDLD